MTYGDNSKGNNTRQWRCWTQMIEEENKPFKNERKRDE